MATYVGTDKEWLDQVNSERAKSGHGEVSYEAFEVIMDKLEKDWFDLVSTAEARICLADFLLAELQDTKEGGSYRRRRLYMRCL